MAQSDDAFPARPSVADRWVDDLLPEELDWRDLVTRYPLVSIGVVALGGFLVGWSQGDRIVTTLSEVASERVNEAVDRYVEFGRHRSGAP